MTHTDDGQDDARKAHSLGVPYWEQITVIDPCERCGYDARLCASDPARCCTRCTHVEDARA